MKTNITSKLKIFKKLTTEVVFYLYRTKSLDTKTVLSSVSFFVCFVIINSCGAKIY